jgi:hypothetical protein
LSVPTARTGYVYGSDAQVIEHGQVTVPAQSHALVYHGVDNGAPAYWVKSDNDAKAGKPIRCRALVKHTDLISCL